MRINVLQHTPNEGPGMISDWAENQGHQLYIYHPYQFEGVLPTADETDMLIILGGPMSSNDQVSWIIDEQNLINQLLKKDIPIFGVCFGAQQIAKALGYKIFKAPYKEVGWAPVYLQNTSMREIPAVVMALHWHEEMFQLPSEATLLFSSDLVKNQGFLLGGKVIGLQFHFEPKDENIREIVINDGKYANVENALKQSAEEIIQKQVPGENFQILAYLLDYISK